MATRSTLFRTQIRGELALPTSSRAWRSPAPSLLGDVDDEDDDVDVEDRLHRLVEHGPVEAVERPVEARRVDEDDLPVGAVEHAEDAAPRRLRLVGDDGDLRPDEGVDERRLPRVRPSRDRDGPGAAAHATPTGRITFTRWTRLRSASSTTNRSPPSSTSSPGLGMCPRRAERRPATVS